MSSRERIEDALAHVRAATEALCSAIESEPDATVRFPLLDVLYSFEGATAELEAAGRERAEHATVEATI